MKIDFWKFWLGTPILEILAWYPHFGNFGLVPPYAILLQEVPGPMTQNPSNFLVVETYSTLKWLLGLIIMQLFTLIRDILHFDWFPVHILSVHSIHFNKHGAVHRASNKKSERFGSKFGRAQQQCLLKYS